MADKALVPVDQREVIFYEDTVTAVLVEVDSREEIYVPVRSLCDYLGIDWSAQSRRINRDPVLSESIQGVAITTTPSADGRGGGQQEMVCLPLKYLPGWLFGISASRVKAEHRDKIIRYQREVYDVLWEAFQEGRLTTTDSDFEALLKQADDEVVQAYQIAQAVVKLARNQIVLQNQVVTNTQRIEELEATLGDAGREVTPEQASQISQGVKAVAIVYGKQTGRNEFGGVYGELYRKFGITSYKLLPAKKFDEAMRFLSDWYGQLTDESLPF